MSKKGENIRKRKDGRWEGRYIKGYTEDGKAIYGSVYGKSYKETCEKKQLAVTHLQDKQESYVSNMSVAELLQLWETANSIRLKGGTKTKYSNIIQMHILPELGDVLLSDISIVQINQFLNQKLQNGRLDGNGGLSPSYVKSIAIILSSALDYAVAEDLCKPFRSKISKPSLPKGDLKILSLEQQLVLESYLRSKTNPTHIGIMISLYMGLRIGEICALTWNDIDFVNNTIFVKHTISRIKEQSNLGKKTKLIMDEPKTPAAKRIIPIPTVLLTILKEYKSSANSIYVISNKESFVNPRTYEARYHRILAECNLTDINYHALRHTFATRCIEAGVDIKTLSEILGHSNVSITLNTYVHSSLEMKAIQINKLNAFLH